MQYSTGLRDDRVGRYEIFIGASPTLEIRSGPPPANLSDPDSGTLLSNISLPSDWLTPPSSGVVSKVGTWEDLDADDTGTAGHFRIKNSGGTPHMQGTVTESGGGGDMIIDNASIVVNQKVTVNTFQITEGNV